MNAPPPSDDGMRAAGVVVTYFPDAGFAARLAAIARETAPVLVVDNTTDDDGRAALRAVCARHGARLSENSANRGLAAALNQAFLALERAGHEWAVTFDQDSTPAPGFTTALRTAAHAGDGPVAAIGANWADEARPETRSRHLQPHRTFPLLFQRAEAVHDLRDVTCVITSGTLFHLPSVRKLGGFDDRLFLDLVDTEFCLRARAAGHRVHVASNARLHHRRGAKRPVRFAGRTWWPAFMPESRLLLLFRNRVLLYRRYAVRFPHWAGFELVYAAKVLAEIVFFEDRKSAKLGACCRGTWHGLLGRSGPPPRDSP